MAHRNELRNHQQRARNHEGDAFSASQADRLRTMSPKNHVDGAEDARRESERGGMGEDEHAHACHLPVGDFGIVGQSRLAQGPDGQARQR